MRLINLRLSLFCFVAMALGVVAAVEFVYGNVIGGVAFCAAFAVLIVLLCLFKRVKWHILAIVCLFAVLGGALTFLQNINFEQREIVERQVDLVGRVSDIGRNGNPANKLYLDDCTVDGKSLDGTVVVSVYDGSMFRTGDMVSASGTLSSMYVFKNSVETYNLRRNVFYELRQDELSVVGAGNLTLAETVRKYVWKVCDEYADERSAGVIYALITGDRNAVEEDVTEVFRAAGISHLLAVSGLHVGVVASVFAFVLRRFKLHPLAEMCIVAVPITAYAYLCGFSPSVVRAVIMAVCVYAARILFGKSDLLTSLSWAGLVLLTVNPLNLYDVGFQLSFLSVFGIATLYVPLSRKLDKLRIPKFLKGVVYSFAMSVCCTAATTPMLMYVYREATLAGVLVNLFAIPMVSAAFVLSLVGMVPWVVHYLLRPADWLVCSVLSAADFLTKFDFTRFTVGVSVVTALVTIVWMFVAGGFVNLGKKGRKVANIALAAVFCCSVLVSALPKPCKTQAFVSFDYGEATVAVMSQRGKVAVVTDFPEKDYALSEVADKVFAYNVKRVTWCVTDFSSVNIDTLSKYVRKGDEVFVTDFSGNDGAAEVLATLGITPVYGFHNLPMGKDVVVTPIYDGALAAVLLSCDGLSVANVVGSDTVAYNFAYLRSDIDVYVSRDFYDSYAAQNKTVISQYQHLSAFNLGANKYGNFTITPKDGTINVIFR